MLNVALNALGNLLSWLNKIEITDAVNMKDLPCVVTEINEMQEYGTPVSPVESNEYRGDTIYRMPKIVQARLFVEGSDYIDFESKLEEIQFDENFVEISSLQGKVYKNLKIKSWAADTNSEMVGARYYNVQFQEFILVSALANLKDMPAGAGSSAQQGDKAPQATKKSAALKGAQRFGVFK